MLGRSIRKWLNPILDPKQVLSGVKGYLWYLRDWRHYSRSEYSERLSLRNAYPCLHDQVQTSHIDSHYFYQNIWAFKKIKNSGAHTHIDVGSLADFVGLLSAITKVIFIDIRPLEIDLDNFESIRGSILDLPFEAGSVSSISCLHVAEHIGLGRYGDSLDPQGTRKAAHELTRVLALNGNLLFSLPIGRPRVCFNAHRIHSPQQILEYFCDLSLVSFSGITDKGEFLVNISPSSLAGANYACGLFHFTKKQHSQNQLGD